MLKWVVTRAPQTMCNEWKMHPDHQWRWHMGTRSPDQKLQFENNNNISSVDAKHYCNEPSSPYNRIGSKRQDSATMMMLTANTPTNVLSNASLNSTASSFRYFVVNNHSSPLKILKHPIDECVSRRSASPRRGSGYRRTTTHRRQQRRRLSSLHIREPSELASPSYRQADDPANDLSNDVLLTPLADRVTNCSLPPTQWQEVWEIFATENEHYNEREIKTPEAERISSLNHDDGQLIRRRAVRRRKAAQTSTKNV
ncbi:uncharacterized protein LOC126562847 [Anopheles maculipalpis]|uniref:uncharacterized protein LOC126562847 n=1 Tax=Anopheles maculipalpis TaxID=1496333 RepID=UPI00215962F9|nr:uncharacterized protein LOC126562847 [Anopheles maculipalpis]